MMIQNYQQSSWMGKTVQNEQVKLSANFCNTVAAAILITGAIGPIFAAIYGLDNRFDAEVIFIGFLVCVLMSSGIHLFGRLILTRMVE